MNVFFDKNKIEVGIDEAGRGCLAGPVVCAAVIMPQNIDNEYLYLQNQIKDSKKLSRKKRKELKEFIEFIALDYSVCYKDNVTIDEINIFNATHQCMHDCLNKLNIIPESILVDGDKFNNYYNNNELIEHNCIIGGDNKYISIASASILAKESHDDYIVNLCNNNKELNQYDWINNMCYGTQKHINGIKKYGITNFHRKSFGICKDY